MYAQLYSYLFIEKELKGNQIIFFIYIGENFQISKIKSVKRLIWKVEKKGDHMGNKHLSMNNRRNLHLHKRKSIIYIKGNKTQEWILDKHDKTTH